jgi:menaquinone-dependent protoporphyrinogen oxidase
MTARQVLVAYATKHEATREIAERIRDVLQGDGLDVRLHDVAEAPDPRPFDAAILGSAVYIGKWRKEFGAFLDRHVAALAAIPVWVFSSGPTGEGDPVELLDGWTHPEGSQETLDRIAPRDVAVFHGVLDPDDLNLVERLMIRQVKAATGDHRDWHAIEAWARGIADELSGEADSPKG